MNFDKIIESLTRNQIIMLSFCIDFILAIIAFYSAIFLRLETIWNIKIINNSQIFIFLLPILLLISSYLFDIQRQILSSLGFKDVGKLFSHALLIGMFLVFIDKIFILNLPRSIPIIFIICFFSLIVIVRFFYLIIRNKKVLPKNKKTVIIYGAGSAGIRLLRSFENSENVNVLGFIDDDKNLKNLKISDKIIYDRKNFEDKYISKYLDEIWIALPTLKNDELESILLFAKKYANRVLALPELNQLFILGEFEKSLKEINPNKFLNRDQISLDLHEFSDSYSNKRILITGAGGSIGSEIAKQIIETNPKSIILLENSEHALYLIDQKIRLICSNSDNKNIEIVSLLGSVCDESRIKNILNLYKIQILIHTAAFKHVPIVENNLLEGFFNNVFGTYNLLNCVTSVKTNVERFIFISSDKAVRPFSIMGKTKRISEKIIQTFSENHKFINFGIVRFGNVLGSSGSVIQLFKKQILEGGPVTVTDTKMTRFFMSIEEASQLVLLAGSYAKKGEVFLLDMGRPVKIIDLAKNMIKFYGFKLGDGQSDKAKIDIKLINKRPGEKLYEELLINNSSSKTNHPKVMIDNSKNAYIDNLGIKMNNALKVIDEHDTSQIIELINELLKEDH